MRLPLLELSLTRYLFLSKDSGRDTLQTLVWRAVWLFDVISKHIQHNFTFLLLSLGKMFVLSNGLDFVFLQLLLSYFSLNSGCFRLISYRLTAQLLSFCGHEVPGL